MEMALGEAPISCTKALRFQKDIRTNWTLYKHLLGPMCATGFILCLESYSFPTSYLGSFPLQSFLSIGCDRVSLFNIIIFGVDSASESTSKTLKRSSNIHSGLGIVGLLVVQVTYHLGTSLTSQEADDSAWSLYWAPSLANSDADVIAKMGGLQIEILRVTTLLGNASVLGQSGLEHASPLASGGIFSNGAADANGWASRFQSEMSGILQPSSAQNWLSSQGSSSGLIVKRTIRVDIPVDKYPNYNFVGRLLGPRGNSLKRVEATTECRVLIRGRGSIKDPAREDMMRGKPGYEHLNEPLHILVEGELPVEIVDARLMQAREILEDLLKPVDESQDYYKKQQLRELAFARKVLPCQVPSPPLTTALRALGACLLVLPVISGSDSTGSPVSANAPNRHRGTGTVCASSNLFLYEVCLSSVWVGGLMAVSHIKGPFGIKDC
ncbi:hypothetical protein NC652_004701 [Populus alba x Populus x berolinensis]|nr:hypothetical protein NC652_004701 [Populus alba x Populus x berolinensis]